jgi:GNAT superfamily N-acetyltransferase
MSVISIIEAADADHFAQVAGLLRDYRFWMRRRYVRHADMIDAYFDEREWESELADLRGHYGPPHGAIVLAHIDGIPAGCVMMRGIGEDVCEMKRLFVRPAFQGIGLARAMVGKLACRAAAGGYVKMRLETGALQTEALTLYRSLGFKGIAPYRACLKWFEDNGRFMEAPVARLTAGGRACECERVAVAA